MDHDEESESESFGWDDAYFELDLGAPRHSLSHSLSHDDDQFEFRVSINSALVPFPGFHPTTYTTTISSANNDHEAAPILDDLDLDISTTPPIAPQMNISTCKRKRVVVGAALGKMMMKLVVKMRSIVSIRAVGGGGINRWFANNHQVDQVEAGQNRQMVKFQKGNKLFGIINNGIGTTRMWRRTKYTTTSSNTPWPTTSSNTNIISSSPPPQPQPHHTSSLLHAAIAHCNQTNHHFSFQL